jgi:hypothetical protein
VAIVERACAREPAERYASADELKRKVEWYLRHRGSLALSDAASERARELYAIIEGGGEVRDRVHHLFAEIRFGFRQAILACQDNEIASAGLAQATRLVVDFELKSGTAEAASSALAELEDPPADLAARVAAALEAREAEKKRFADLEKMSEQLDPLVGQRTRLGAGLIVGASWVLAPEVGGFLLRGRTARYEHIYAVTGVVIAIGVLVAIWGRESLSKTMINRRSLAMVGVMFATLLALQLGGQLAGLPVATTLSLHVLVWFLTNACYTLLLDRRFWFVTLLCIPAFLWSCLTPAHVFHMMSLASLGVLLTVMVAWMSPRSDARFFVARVKQRVRR